MRNNLFKIYSLILIPVIFLFAVSFASENDCGLSTPGARVQTSSWGSYSGAMSYPDLLVAYDHLYAYCCKQSLFPENQGDCVNAPKEVYLESAYMIDHLVDVGFKRLDVVAAYSGQIVDSGAKAWYTFLHNATGALSPLLVQTQYKNNWSLTHVPLLQDEAADIKAYLPLYSGFSLRDKYYNLCYVIKNAYEKVLQPDKTSWTIEIGDQYNASSFYSACMRLAEEKVKNELIFTQTVMIDRSSSALETSMQSYTLVNFVKDRLMGLLSKLQSVVSLFGQIGKQAPISKRCAQ